MDDKRLSLNWLDDLKSRADIVGVVGSYVSLVRKGGKYWACCPFHSERTPSFSVDENLGLWYCFGACHEGGDVIGFEMKINNISYIEAIKRLAARVGMKLPENFSNEGNIAKKDKLYEMMVAAARYYRDKLAESEEAKRYLSSRGISERTAKIFGLGYSPDARGLIDHLTELGYSRKDMYDCSLLGERDGQYYDFQSGRLIVPIFDAFGKVIGFGGRVLVKKDNVAKYKNSRESVLFDKKRVLYGLNYVKKSRIGNPIQDIILVEGYMDVIGLYQAGVKNAVASMGTALTDIQAKVLKSFVDTVYICYDGDEAGQKSTLRGLEILKQHDIDVRVMTLPDGVDPDELVREGAEPFLNCKKQALPLYDYLLKKAEDGLNLDTASGMSEYVKRALDVVAELPTIEKNVYLDYISKKSNVGKSRLESVLNARKPKKDVAVKEKGAEAKQEIDLKEKKGAVEASRFAIYYMLSDPLDQDRLIDREWLVYDTHKLIYDYVIKSIAEGRAPNASSAYQIDGCDKVEIDAIFGYESEGVDQKSYFEDCKAHLKKRFLTERLDELRELAKTELDQDRAAAIKKQINDLILKLKSKKNQ